MMGPDRDRSFGLLRRGALPILVGAEIQNVGRPLYRGPCGNTIAALMEYHEN